MFANHKGGCGKTTSTANLAVALAARGRRVLVVDADPQANLSEAFGVTGELAGPRLEDALAPPPAPAPDVIWDAPAGVNLIPCSARGAIACDHVRLVDDCCVMRRTLCAGLSSVLLIVSGSGCGGPSEDAVDPIPAAVGAESRADEARLDRYMETAARLPHEFATFIRSLKEGDLGAARTAVDAMTATLSRAQNQAADFEGRRLRDTIGAYTSKVRAVVNAYKRMLTYLEASSHVPGRMDELTAEIVRASRSLEAADRRLTRRLADAIPASERDEFWRDHRERREELRKKRKRTAGDSACGGPYTANGRRPGQAGRAAQPRLCLADDANGAMLTARRPGLSLPAGAGPSANGPALPDCNQYAADPGHGGAHSRVHEQPSEPTHTFSQSSATPGAGTGPGCALPSTSFGS